MKCPLCQSFKLHPFHRWPRYEVLECCDCCFRFIDTQSKQYPKDAQYCYDELEIGKIQPNLPHIRRRIHDILSYAKPPPGTALDVGCGKGEVSLALASHGFQCAGIDMKKKVIDHLKEHHPEVSWRCAMTDELQEEGQIFDIITMYHVLEHISNPVECLTKITKLLRPGGLTVIEVPNMGGLEARLKGPKWHYYKVDHVNYFRPPDLRRVGDLSGLEFLGMKGYQHFSHPQDVWWKDFIKGGMARLGFQDVISMFFRMPA